MTDHNAMSGSMSRSASQPNCLDPLDSLLDLSSYDTMAYGSPSISPCESTKSVSFHHPAAAAATTTTTTATPTANTLLPPSQQTLAGPSHPYDAHKQQTGIPTGGLATTLALNNNSQLYAGYGYLSSVDTSDDFSGLSFGDASNSGSASSGSFEQLNMDLDFESPTVDPAFFFPPMPTATDYTTGATTSPQQPAIKVESSNVGRLWPGMHQQQAALAAKAQQQRKQQQHQQYMMQQQQQQQRQSSVSVASSSTQQSKSKTRPATDPIVEEKISQLLNSMRQNSEASSNRDDGSTPNGQSSHGNRSRKDEEDMDEDERLLASEEGKKLSSKERRQLRNKVSARAFRSRRKEYIGQLEGEISTKVNENAALRTENRALREENERLTDLTRMLLSSPSFSGFLEKLSTNPNATSEAPQRQQPTPPAVPEQQQQQQDQEQQPTASAYLSKDVNPYLQQQQLDMNINYAILPDAAPLDLSLLDLSQHDFIYQPQVFSVHSVEEVSIDTSILSGKSSSAAELASFSDDDKLDIPLFSPSIPEMTPSSTHTTAIAATSTSTDTTTTSTPPKPDAEFDSNPLFSLFAPSTSSTDTTPTSLPLDTISLLAAIQPAKHLLNFELVDAAEAEMKSERAVMRVQRLCVGIDAVAARLEILLGDDA